MLELGEIRNVAATTNYIFLYILGPNALLADGYHENLMPPVYAILIEALGKYIVKATKSP